MPRKYFTVFFLYCTILSCCVVVTHAQQRPPVPAINLTYLRIDFTYPSARPAALGGAFIAAAQDGSAAAVNPAGLTYLKSAGASLNQRHVRTQNSEPQGSPSRPNGQTDFQTINFDQTMVGVFVPFKRFTIAGFRHVAFDSRFNFETRQFLTTNEDLTTRQVLGGLGNFPGRKVNLDLEMVNDAISLAVEVHKRLSLGFAFKTSVLNFRFDEHTYLDPEVANGNRPRDNIAETTYAVNTLEERNVLIAATFGFMSKVVVDKLFLGGVINLNPTFDLETTIFLPQYNLGSVAFPAESPEEPTFRIPVPNTYGLGIYYIAKRRLHFTFDVISVQYTDLLKGNDLNAVEDDEFDPETGEYLDPDGKDDLTIEDAIELHFGMEYLFRVPGLGLMPLRFGVFTNPGHRIYSANPNPDLKRLYPKQDDRVHFTFGLGVVLNSYLKFDVSVNRSKDLLEITGSTLLSIPF